MSPAARTAATGLAAAALAALLVACSGAEAATVEPPSSLVEVDGSDVPQVVLTAEAAAAAGIVTDKVEAAVRPAPADLSTAAGPSGRPRPAPRLLQMPYSALLYYLDGTTWVYTKVADLTYRRVPVTVADVAKTVVHLSVGPAVGTEVVVTGAPEILGSELEISGEQ